MFIKVHSAKMERRPHSYLVTAFDALGNTVRAFETESLQHVRTVFASWKTENPKFKYTDR